MFNAGRTWSVSNDCNVCYVRTHICFTYCQVSFCNVTFTLNIEVVQKRDLNKLFKISLFFGSDGKNVLCRLPAGSSRYYLQPVCVICVTVVCYCILWCQFSRVAVCATVGTVVHGIK